jgi:small subunit ribosomal protein S5
MGDRPPMAGDRRPQGGRPQFGRRPDRMRPVVHDEFKERVLDNRRVTRVVAGGKRFRFRVTIVIGDEKGRVGIGVAKGLDVQQAVAKAKADAKKHIVLVGLKDGRTIAHEVGAKYSAAKVMVKPASKGHGLRAGGSVRFVLAFAGIKDATAKVLGRTPNKLTNAMATIEALKKLKA